FFFSRRRQHTRFSRDWSSDVCSSDLFSGSSSFLTTSHANFSQTSSFFLESYPRPLPLGLLGSLSSSKPSLESSPNTKLSSSDKRSEERRVGKECRSRGQPHLSKHHST